MTRSLRHLSSTCTSGVVCPERDRRGCRQAIKPLQTTPDCQKARCRCPSAICFGGGSSRPNGPRRPRRLSIRCCVRGAGPDEALTRRGGCGPQPGVAIALCFRLLPTFEPLRSGDQELSVERVECAAVIGGLYMPA